MLDWLKYAPIKLRQSGRPCIPQGPSFSNKHSIKVFVDKNEISFNAPRHNYLGARVEPLQKTQSNDSLSFSEFNDGVMADDSWVQSIFFRRSWTFWGPWFSGSKAHLSMGAAIIARREGKEYGSKVSFFHPRAFEKIAADYLNSSYGHFKEGGGTATHRGTPQTRARRHHRHRRGRHPGARLPVFAGCGRQRYLRAGDGYFHCGAEDSGGADGGRTVN